MSIVAILLVLTGLEIISLARARSRLVRAGERAPTAVLHGDEVATGRYRSQLEPLWHYGW